MTEQTQRPLSAAQIGQSLANAIEPRGDATSGDLYPSGIPEAAGIVVEWLNHSGLREEVESILLADSDEIHIVRCMMAYVVMQVIPDGRFEFPSVETMMATLGERTVSFNVAEDQETMVLQVHPESAGE